jgi:alkylation response protein AidB-like acyl-CoA dehydrogenase
LTIANQKSQIENHAMAFRQTPPRLGNQYGDDRALRSYLARVLPASVLRQIEPSLSHMGGLAGGELYQLQLADRLNEPRLTRWDAWGNRIDRIEVSPLWRVAERLATEQGLVAVAYERAHGRFSRIHQCALAYLFTPSTDIYSCPLAMTDGAARAILESGNRALTERVLPHLTARDPQQFWTSGQWMTETTGGSDVGLTETIARRDGEGRWRLYGKKWFTSAAASQIALTLARPEGNGPGGRGLALFYVETRDEEGHLRNITINRLKDKLGTKKVPTAELTLDGTPAELVASTTDGVRAIAPMLIITRLWNGISAAALMRRGVALARDYAQRRFAFGGMLSEKPLHVDTLAGLFAESDAALHLTFRAAELIGLHETGEISDEQARLLRVLVPIMKLTTARQAVSVASEVLECFGGAGYVEDTGVPVLLRDTQVLPIWEGTTNVLALDALRAVGSDGAGLAALKMEVESCASEARRVQQLETASDTAVAAFARAHAWFESAAREGQSALEAGARRFALTLGRATALALMSAHASWSFEHERDQRAISAARRFALSGIDLIVPMSAEDARSLVE